MANKHASLDALFADIADAIREKTGDTASIIADDFPSVIRERLQMMLISFTIEGTSFQAEEGMTWAEWVNSEYNTVKAEAEPNGYYVWFYMGTEYPRMLTFEGNIIKPNSTIISGSYGLEA